MLWQSAHSEYCFCEVFWPASRKVDFLRACGPAGLRDYAARHRRYGAQRASSRVHRDFSTPCHMQRHGFGSIREYP
ncbi:UDP diphosphate synthase [Streptomyces sp. SID5466]|uniref:Predicted protein n=1 Tax=Streptomyces filamentosus NRRL 15998 TaxID=457431 RepID=D6AJG9_STRFL|nr:predicted protein [Streptomyces filamentosus NRRL 15998]MYR81185.1 UDP diphosphate synthase [Streptomyces sp. SID5466]